VDKLFNKLVHDGKYVSNFLTWFSLWGPIVTAIFNPVLLNIQYQKQHIPKHERKMLVLQEIGKQTINVVTMVSLFGLTLLSIPFLMKRYFKPNLHGNQKSKAVKDDLTSLLTNVTGFIVLTFLSPILTPLVTRYWNQKLLSNKSNPTVHPLTESQTVTSAVTKLPSKMPSSPNTFPPQFAGRALYSSIF
jgi:hypothetical protein